MANVFLSLVVNSILVALLLATIIYCLRLNRRIAELQDGKSELARIIHEFDESTTRATQNINEIHKATERIAENIQLKIDKANYLANDLDMLIERGGKLSGKPSDTVARPAAPARPMTETVTARVPQAEPRKTEAAEESTARRSLRGRSRVEQELINMLGGKKSGA